MLHDFWLALTALPWVDICGSLLLFFLVFGMSATVDTRAMVKQVKNKSAILTGIFLQFVVLPFLGFVVVKILNMSHASGLTLLVVTSSPGGSYSNWFCSMFNADLALSVTMTAISTLLSVIMLPLNLLLYTRYSYEDDVVSQLDWASLFTALAVVISAIILGLFVSAKVKSHRFNKISNRCGNFSGLALVVFSATMSNTGGDAKLWEHPWTYYVSVAAPCILGLTVANLLTTIVGLKKPERVTTSIECCYQNVGIATSVALTMFEGNDLSEAMGVPLFYGLVEAVAVAIYCIICWKCSWTKAPRNASFWTVIATSYEVVEAEMIELEAIEVSLDDKPSESSAETTSTTGDTIFHYFAHCGTLDNVEDTPGRVTKPWGPSGYDLGSYPLGSGLDEDDGAANTTGNRAGLFSGFFGRIRSRVGKNSTDNNAEAEMSYVNMDTNAKSIPSGIASASIV
jgi:predicted Na+-dependent transporter